jgi:hypothetical protein
MEGPKVLEVTEIGILVSQKPTLALVITVYVPGTFIPVNELAVPSAPVLGVLAAPGASKV